MLQPVCTALKKQKLLFASAYKYECAAFCERDESHKSMIYANHANAMLELARLVPKKSDLLQRAQRLYHDAAKIRGDDPELLRNWYQLLLGVAALENDPKAKLAVQTQAYNLFLKTQPLATRQNIPPVPQTRPIDFMPMQQSYCSPRNFMPMESTGKVNDFPPQQMQAYPPFTQPQGYPQFVSQLPQDYGPAQSMQQIPQDYGLRQQSLYGRLKDMVTSTKRKNPP